MDPNVGNWTLFSVSFTKYVPSRTIAKTIYTVNLIFVTQFYNIVKKNILTKSD